MATGWYPFRDKIEKRLRDKIWNDKFKIPQHISVGLRDLLLWILEKDPEKRFTLDEIVEHYWFEETPYNDAPGFILGKDLIEVNDSILKRVQEYGYDLEYTK